MPTVTFIRHGQSESNAGLPTEHPATSPLTELGRRQAEHAAQAFSTPPGLIVTSPYLRTQQTAQPLLEQFPEVAHLEWPVQEFTYLHPSNWQGTTWLQRKAVAQAYWERFDPAYRDGEGAETWLELIARIEHTRQLILEQKVDQFVVFSHGLFTRSFWWRMAVPHLPLNAESMRHYSHFVRGLAIPNCAFLKFNFADGEVWCKNLELAHLHPELLSH